AGLYQLMQVSFECMMWKSCQRHRVGSAVTSFSEGNAKDSSRDGSVAVECFIKIAHAKQQHGIGIAAFYFPVLLHQRSFFLFLCHSSKVKNRKNTLDLRRLFSCMTSGHIIGGGGGACQKKSL